ncbi:hypothetical protein BPC006_I1135 [Burkholderia pseudomallei BPC006]|nr:hypothetical protein BPC006_I1135 [Burkholderia pseudomallei BPC006]
MAEAVQHIVGKIEIDSLCGDVYSSVGLNEDACDCDDGFSIVSIDEVAKVLADR